MYGSVKCQFYSSRTTATGKQSTLNSTMGPVKAGDVGSTEFRNEKLLASLSVIASTGDPCVAGAGHMSRGASGCFSERLSPLGLLPLQFLLRCVLISDFLSRVLLTAYTSRAEPISCFSFDLVIQHDAWVHKDNSVNVC